MSDGTAGSSSPSPAGKDESGGEPRPRRSLYQARVGYIDTDQGGVCHHGAYLRWLEAARVEHWKGDGLDYRSWEREQRLGLPVVELRLRYRSPGRFDDPLEIETWLSRGTPASLRYASVIRTRGRVLVEAEVRVACVGLDDGQLRRVPQALLGPGD